MNSKLTMGFILGMTFFYATTFGQTNGIQSEKIKEGESSEVYSGLLLNSLSAILDYRKVNSTQLINNKMGTGYTGWNFILDWCRAKIFSFFPLLFCHEGRDVKRNGSFTSRQYIPPILPISCLKMHSTILTK